MQKLSPKCQVVKVWIVYFGQSTSAVTLELGLRIRVKTNFSNKKKISKKSQIKTVHKRAGIYPASIPWLRVRDTGQRQSSSAPNREPWFAANARRSAAQVLRAHGRAVGVGGPEEQRHAAAAGLPACASITLCTAAIDYDEPYATTRWLDRPGHQCW